MSGATSEHFSFLELACHHKVNLATQLLVDSLEALRTLARTIKPDATVQVNDATRCPICNAKAGGVAKSQHELGTAADVQVEGFTPEQLYHLALQIPAFCGGGCGVSLTGHYVHLDVRESRARWCYDAVTGKECAWDHKFDPPQVVT